MTLEEFQNDIKIYVDALPANEQNNQTKSMLGTNGSAWGDPGMDANYTAIINNINTALAQIPRRLEYIKPTGSVLKMFNEVTTSAVVTCYDGYNVVDPSTYTVEYFEDQNILQVGGLPIGKEIKIVAFYGGIAGEVE